MSQNRSFARKVVYATCIALLLYPLYYLGQPATRDAKGGRLAQMRAEQGIAQSQLGDIDPASETMRLATLGLRGVAVTLLWEKANEFKKKKDWDNLSATVQQIIKLQPNYISVWEFQGHNLAYNVSVEFDDYRHRYEWVKRGTEFLVQGSQYNRDDPGLLWYIGWVVGQKIGRADERLYFRRLFRVDEDFHRSMQENGQIAVDSPDARSSVDGRPDNWLVARLWYDKGIAAIRGGKSLRRKSPLVYYNNAFMQRINHATMIEDEGTLDEKSVIAWQRAGDDWKRFGDMLIPTTWGHNIRMSELPKLYAELRELVAKLDELTPGLRDQLVQEKTVQLTEEERSAQETPPEKRSREQQMSAYMARYKTRVTHNEVAERAPDAVRSRVKELAIRITELEDVYIDHTTRYRDQVNYSYWALRCTFEQTDDAIQARRHLRDADLRLEEVNPDAARVEFELAWDRWAALFEQFPELMNEETLTNLAAPMSKYMEVLGQLDLKIPDDFKLRKVWEQQKMLANPTMGGGPKSQPGGTDELLVDPSARGGTKPSAPDQPVAKPPTNQ